MGTEHRQPEGIITMSTTATTDRQPLSIEHNSRSPNAWIALLVWTAGIVAASDLLFFVLIRTVIPPLAIGVLLTFAGIALLRIRVRIGIAVLGVVATVLLVGNLPFALPHLRHPASAFDFLHALVGTAGRVLVIMVAVAALRSSSALLARRVAVSALGLAGLSVAVAGIAMIATTGDRAEAQDHTVEVEYSQFPAQITVARGETLFVDNLDLFRHTFTVTGTDLDVELPAGVGVRVPIELPTGTYDVLCAVPGHESMVATLQVDPAEPTA